VGRSDRGDGGERLAQQWVNQWAQQRAQMRAERRAEPVITTGPSNFSRAQVPWGLDLAAAWSWRLIVITVATLGLLWTMRHFAVLTVPLAIALLVAALCSPVVRGLQRAGLPRGGAALVTVVLGLTTVVLLLVFVGQQVMQGVDDLTTSVVDGLDRVRDWLRTGPLDLTDSQVDGWIQQVQERLASSAQDSGVEQAAAVGSALTHVVAGFFIVLFATYFFLADGDRIWAWLVRLAPRAARRRVDDSGHVAWVSLTQFVRATVLIAAFDAVFIMIGAWVLGVPFVAAIGVLVFLGAFVPMIGATVAGSVAVLVALVDPTDGPLGIIGPGLPTALAMLGVIVLVQQVEGHLLQPFLMGRFVSIHPLGIILAIGAGVLLAGVAGALVAVPLAAAGNAVVQHLARWTEVGDDDPETEPPGPESRPDVPRNDGALGDEHPRPTETDAPSEVHDFETQSEDR
jgi:predicted PurR-regulated permease PerM